MIPALFAALAAPCTPEGPADAPLAVAAPDDAESVQVVLVLRVDDAHLDWASSLRDVLDARDVEAGLSIPLRAPTEPLADFLNTALASGHQAVVRLDDAQIPRDSENGPARLRKTLKPLTRAIGKIKATEAPIDSRLSEAVLHRAGLKAVLETNGPANATPRSQLRFEAQPDNGVILPSGPYTGCAGSPVVQGFTPAAADRATQAIFGSRTESPGVVRVVLVPSDQPDAEVLARWLDTVVLPAGIAIGPPEDARQRSLRGERTLAGEQATASGGRLVRIDEVREAAAALDGLETLPRALPGDLSLTEAFQAFLKVVAEDTEGQVVRLSSLEGPPSLAKSALVGPTPIDREALIDLARALLADDPERIPAALPVGGKLLTAAELLGALALAVRDEPVLARPTEVPEPSAPGLGWGRATTP